MKPLTQRLQPTSLDAFLGQKHLIPILKHFIERKFLPSLILWGPPGSGKTTLAKLLAHALHYPFYELNAITASTKNIKEIIEQPESLFDNKIPIVFVDELHRFNKAQQAVLLAPIEQRKIIFIGATTENPSFSVIPPLLSRCQVYTLEPLSDKDLMTLLQRALKALSRPIKVETPSLLLKMAAGDARKLLNFLELVEQSNYTTVNAETLKVLLPHFHSYHDTEAHYALISAFIKSVRGSAIDAALYWLARLLEGGEDPRFIARRLVILAAEDIGLANPNALLLAQATYDAVQNIGMPEAQIILSECTIFLAASPKSNSAYKAIKKARAVAQKTRHIKVPKHLRNAPTTWMQQQGYGKDYLYPHDYPNHYVKQTYLPEELKSETFYIAGDNTYERRLQQQINPLKTQSDES